MSLADMDEGMLDGECLLKVEVEGSIAVGPNKVCIGVEVGDAGDMHGMMKDTMGDFPLSVPNVPHSTMSILQIDLEQVVKAEIK